MSGNRRRIRAASFGPEWVSFGHMASWLLSNSTPREEVRMRAHLRDARRDLKDKEARRERWAARVLDRPANYHPTTVALATRTMEASR